VFYTGTYNSRNSDTFSRAMKIYAATWIVGLGIAFGGTVALYPYFNAVSSSNSATMNVPQASIIKDTKTGRCFTYIGDSGSSAVLANTPCSSSARTLMVQPAP